MLAKKRGNMSEFEQFDVIEKRLKKYKKSRAWLNTVNSRDRVFPKCIRQKRLELVIKEGHIQLGKGKKPIMSKQGSVFSYPKGTADYIEEVILLHDIGKKSFSDIKRELQGKLDALNQQIETSLVGDKRVKESGFFHNYRAAVHICKKYDVLGERQATSQQWKNLLEDRSKIGTEYYAALQKMKQFGEKKYTDLYREAEEEKNRLGEKLDFIHAIMETVIKHALSFLKGRYPKGGEYMRYWFEAIREIEKEDNKM
jgi:predicted CopG family antitoxin